MMTEQNNSHVCKSQDTNGDVELGGGRKKRTELKVYFTPDHSWRRKVHLERYLIGACILLFCACIAFAVVAFIRDRRTDERFCLTQNCILTASSIIQVMDSRIDPCDNFYQYACGMWIKNHIIPDDKPSFTTFEKLHDDLQAKLKLLLEEEVNSKDTGSTAKAKIFYKSCIDTKVIQEVGDVPFRRVLDDVGGWPVVTPSWSEHTWVLEDVLGGLRTNYNAPIFIDTWVSPDDKNSSSHVLQMDQASLGMPSREYFLSGSDVVAKKAYFDFMVEMAVILGANREQATRQMEQVLRFEEELANITIPQDERHDTGALYHKMTIKELQTLVPQIDWLRFINRFMPIKVDEKEYIVTFTSRYLKDLGTLLHRHTKRLLANYLIWRFILGLVPDLPEDYQMARTKFRKVMQGVSQDQARWQKCIESVNGKMGMAVGRLFVQDSFNEESKETALEMIHSIRDAFNNILDESDWMDSETKAVAKEKANAMHERIGYPDFLTNATELDEFYGDLEFAPGKYFENNLRIERHLARRMMSRLRKPVLKEKWEHDPAIVNAFYNPNTNDIVFPAGILQPPFYSQHFPKSLNYGGIGVVIGHEITHGFDDKGRQYDKAGNLKQWWKNETIEAFRNRAQCMIDQYSNYTLEPFGLKINGKNTQGENIADNGGLKESFRAYRKWVDTNGEELLFPGIPLNHDQLFFLNYAQIWCGKMRDEEAVNKIRTSVHSPGPIRVLVPLSNSEDFARAYNCPVGSKMNPVKKCSLW